MTLACLTRGWNILIQEAGIGGGVGGGCGYLTLALGVPHIALSPSELFCVTIGSHVIAIPCVIVQDTNHQIATVNQYCDELGYCSGTVSPVGNIVRRCFTIKLVAYRL